MKSAIRRQRLVLDPEARSPEVLEFEGQLRSRVIGQERAVRRMVNMYQIYLAGMTMPGRPIGTMLFLGPTGSGKTRVVEAAADILFGSPRAFIKVDCAEFQHSHEIAKLIGSPPGYLGHRETPPLLTQEALDQYHTDRLKFGFVLFDEIEKADDAVWQLLLGVLDKGILTLGDNRRVDFSRTLVLMTSNLGAAEMRDLMEGGIGFAGTGAETTDFTDVDQKIYRTATAVARKKFTPEFMNRIDKVVVFRTLTRAHLREIVELELDDVRARVIESQGDKQFGLHCSDRVKEFLVEKGTDPRYGARHLRRVIERYLVFPLSNLIATDQIQLGDMVRADLDEKTLKLTFSREPSVALPELPDPSGNAEQESQEQAPEEARVQIQRAS